MGSLSAVLPVLLMLSGFFGWASPVNHALVQLSEANDAFRRGNYATAAESYRRLLTDPDDLLASTARFNLANTLFMQAHYPDALTLYRELAGNAKQADPSFRAAALFNAGNTCAAMSDQPGNRVHRRDQLLDALRCYRRALLLTPGDDDIRVNYEIIYRRLHAPEHSRKADSRTQHDSMADRLLRSEELREHSLLRSRNISPRHAPSGMPDKPW